MLLSKVSPNYCRQATITALCALFAAGYTSLVVAQSAYFRNGCKVGPEYCRPVAPVASGWLDEANPHVGTWTSREQLWWVSFNDPTLGALIQSAYDQNLSLRSAGMRVLQAEAQRDIASGNLFPQLQQGFGAYNRIAESLQVANRSPDRNRFFNDWILGGQLAWELDFWGQFRRNLAASDARLDAQLEDYDDVLVILVADVAKAYIDYRTYEQRLVYARQNLGIQSESVRLARIKVEAGTRESDLDLPQAQADLANTEALIPDLELGRRQSMNRLSVLLGLPPADLTTMLGAGPIPVPPPDLALGIPADLLRQRPDVRRAERDLAAQCEEIGIAVADLYPHVSINGTIFVNSEKFSNLFTPKSWGGAVGPAFRWDILNYGRLRANVRLQETRFNELIFNYQHKVLLANEEVENAIASFLYSHQRTNAFQSGATVSIDAVDIGTKRYKDGVSDFNRLSNLQVVLARQQDSLAFSQGQIAQSWVDVYRSLGGGWQIRLTDAQPYRPGISTLPQTGNDSLPPPTPVSPAPSKPEPTPANSDQTSSTSPQKVTKTEPPKTDQARPTIMSRLAAAKTFLLHRKPAPSKMNVQIAQPPMLECPPLLFPEGTEREADWSDLVDISPSAPSENLDIRQSDGEPSNTYNADAAAPCSPRTLSEYWPAESMIVISRLNPESSNISATHMLVQPSAIRSTDEPFGSTVPSEVRTVFSNRADSGNQSVRTGFAERAAEFNRLQPVQPRDPQPEATPQHLADETLPIQDTDRQSTVTPPAAEEVPCILFSHELQSSRKPGVLDPKYTR